MLCRLIRFLKRPSADSSGETDVEGDLLMDSAIEISSGSDSDDEVPKPVRREIKTRTDPPWLAGIVFGHIFFNFCLSSDVIFGSFLE